MSALAKLAKLEDSFRLRGAAMCAKERASKEKKIASLKAQIDECSGAAMLARGGD
jgi:hypothetical protein